MAQSKGMYIWAQWLKRDSYCSECQKAMEKGEAAVKGSMRTADNHYFRFTWHMECWKAQATRYLEANPYQVKTRPAGPGRPRMNLSAEQNLKRSALITRFSRLGDKKRLAVDLDLMEKLAALQTEGQDIMRQMEELGGVPPSWTRGR